MRRAHPTTAAVALLAGSLWTVPAPAAGDWLVTRDGGKVETQGAWKVQGKRVVFTAQDGTLASLRLTEVDLDASRQATSAAAQAREERVAQAAAPPKQSIRVLTDKDFPKPVPSPLTPAAEGTDPATAPAAAGENNPAAPSSSSALQVASWKRERDAERDLMKISGLVRNTGPDLATAVQVTIRLYEEGGELLATQQAALDTRTLQPGQGTSFQAEIPAINGFASAKFEVRSIPLVRRDDALEAPVEGGPPSR